MTPKNFFSTVLTAMLGTAVVFGVLGYIFGASSAAPVISADADSRFTEGVVVGVQLKREFEEWKDSGQGTNDVRSEPRTRCAGRFFDDEVRLAGCVQGIERPPDGYSIPR